MGYLFKCAAMDGFFWMGEIGDELSVRIFLAYMKRRAEPLRFFWCLTPNSIDTDRRISAFVNKVF